MPTDTWIIRDGRGALIGTEPARSGNETSAQAIARFVKRLKIKTRYRQLTATRTP